MDASFFELLKREAAPAWQAYSHHAFVQGLGNGTLPQAAFKHYLVQDYIFLIHYARAYALAAYKADDVVEMRASSAAAHGILNDELALHVNYCRSWGLDEAAVLATPEHAQNMAYTRYVLERGAAGDFLDLIVALAPCTMGYAEIGRRLMNDPTTKRAGNPYLPWIESYGGNAFQAGAEATRQQLDRVAARRLGQVSPHHPRFADLAKTFEAATRLEVGFWDMGLSAGL